MVTNPVLEQVGVVSDNDTMTNQPVTHVGQQVDLCDGWSLRATCPVSHKPHRLDLDALMRGQRPVRCVDCQLPVAWATYVDPDATVGLVTLDRFVIVEPP